MVGKTLRRFWHEEAGATALEYGLLCALVFLVAAAAMGLMATEVTKMFDLLINTWTAAVK
jgi:pilus assembly protein Flp/PilA